MSGLSDQFPEHVDLVFLNSDEFAETIEYRPKGTGTPVSIRAVIDRRPDRESLVEGRALVREARISIAADATNGVVTISLSDSVKFDDRWWHVISTAMNSGMHEIEVAATKRDRIASPTHYDEPRRG